MVSLPHSLLGCFAFERFFFTLLHLHFHWSAFDVNLRHFLLIGLIAFRFLFFFVCFTCEIVTATAIQLRCLGYSANFPRIGFANTIETGQHVDDRHPPSPMACGIRDRVSSEWLSSNARNNTK